jgi:hypothetical protein
MDNKILVTINDDDVKSSNTDSGYYLDEIARGLELWDSLELDENNLEYFDESVKYVLDNYDFETAFINWANENPNEIFKSSNVGNARDKALFESQELKAGAFLALTFPDWFSDELDKFEEAEKEAVSDNEPTRSSVGQEAETAYSDSQESLYSEWLNGDRNSIGLLDTLSQHLTDERRNVTYNESNGSFLEISFDREEAFTFIEDESGDEIDENISSEDLSAKLKTAILDNLERNASKYTEKQKQELEKRRLEYARIKEYQKGQAEKAEALRIEKLKGMVKSETNENK